MQLHSETIPSSIKIGQLVEKIGYQWDTHGYDDDTTSLTYLKT
jgi:hypothetical protein